MITKIHFIRHGLTEGNLKHWVYGSIDVPLAPEGEADIKGYKEQKVLNGINDHHKIEAMFKAFAKALDEATTIDPRSKGVLSTKGTL